MEILHYWTIVGNQGHRTISSASIDQLIDASFGSRNGDYVILAVREMPSPV